MKVNLGECEIVRRETSSQYRSLTLPAEVHARLSDFCRKRNLKIARTLGAVINAFIDEREAEEGRVA